MKETKNVSAIQITTDENEKQREKLAADHFFSSLLGQNKWPDLGEKQSVYDRLKKLEQMGYPLALPWAVMSKDDHTSWGDGEKGIKQFLGIK